MFVVNTTSATAVRSAPRRRPEKRVPSSRRRNPGENNSAVTSGRGSGAVWRGGRRALRRGCQREYRRAGDRCRSGGRARRLVEDRLRRVAARRRQLEHERKPEEYSTAPPACLGEEAASLAHADERVGGGARAAEAGSESAPLSALQHDGRNEHEGVENQEDEQEGVKHSGDDEGRS